MRRNVVGFVRKPVGYIRVSTREQAESKLSLDHQKEKVHAYATTQDLKVDEMFNDAAESAKDLRRPAIQNLLEQIKQGRISHVIVYKLDRLIRSVENLGYLIRFFDKYNVTLSSVSEHLNTATASGRMVVNLLGMIAQWERETIAERTRDALRQKRKRKEKLGGKVPYGYQARRGKLTPHPKEQKILKGILKSYEKGEQGYTAIAEALNKKGVRPKKGKKWYASTIRAIVQRDEKERE